ncbi:MAG: DUF4846 domain-containing protein [Acidobacteriota bacterium]|nr:DUF4846 domain-containing protein [Acidobacteriota bacterium]
MPTMIRKPPPLLFILLTPIAVLGGHPWLTVENTSTLAQNFPPPRGYTRLPADTGDFAAWLRGLPIRSDKTVYLYNGRKKPRQDVQVAVIDIDTGKRDLQQCADAVMRLHAEYLFQKDPDAVSFNFTSGHPARWSAWRNGQRPKISGNRVTWRQTTTADASYKNFRKYLRTVFVYAGSASLEREWDRVRDPRKVQPGDSFIQGGFPGHAVIVLDVVENQKGERMFLLGQSYMPAQDIHVLKGPRGKKNPWYPARSNGTLKTPEWTFEYTDLYRRPVSEPSKQ